MIWTMLLLFGGPVVPTLLLLNIPIKGHRSGKRFWVAAFILMALALAVLFGSWIGATVCKQELCGLGWFLYGGGTALVLLLAAFVVAIVSKFVSRQNVRREAWKHSQRTYRR